MAKTKAKTPAAEQPTTQPTNHTLVYRKAHPKDRVSYGIPPRK
jgi:hypothetical protein